MNLFKNQPKTKNDYGQDFSALEFINKNCNKLVPVITAMNIREIGEATLLGFDVEENGFDGIGKIEMSEYGPKLLLPKRTIKEKSIFKIMGAEVVVGDKVAQVYEFGNDAAQYEAKDTITNTNKGFFTNVTGLIAGDKVKLVKVKSTSSTVPAIVKITDVDTTTKEITFDTNVTIEKGDYIRFISSPASGCLDNHKTSAGSVADGGKMFEYPTQFFAREVKIQLDEFNQFFRKGSQQFDKFVYKYWGEQAIDIYKEVAHQLRYGSGVKGATSEIKGYNTVIEERETAGLESIIDFSSLTTAEEYQNKLETILGRVNTSPIQSKFILIANKKFLDGYKNMMRKLYSDAEARACCNLVDTLHHGIMKWNIEDAPMIDHYYSESLSYDERHTGVAYILPVDMIAGFVPPYLKAEMSTGPNSKLVTTQGNANMFGAIMTREKYSQSTAECKTYEHYTRLGFLYAGVSFRDTYFRLDNFNFGI